MARGQRPMKGFRPGKEPPELRKKRAKEQFGDVNAAQERLIELFAERTPEEARALIRRWTIGLLAGAIILAAAAGVLYVVWSPVAAIVAGVLALLVAVVWWRIRSQRQDLETMVDAVSGPGRGKRR